MELMIDRDLFDTIANHDEWPGLLLFEHMKRNGFDDSWFGSGPMMSVVKNPVWDSYESAIVPFEKKFRNHMFQMSRFINLGDMLKFPNEMKSKVPPPLTIASALRSFPEQPFNSIMMAIVAAGFSLFSNMRELNKMSYIEGWVCEHNNPPFSTFPFDQWLRVGSVATTWLDLYDQNGKLWRLGTVVLSDYKQLRILRFQVTEIPEKLGSE
ncbi:MAG: hypothetical protein ACYCZH_05150 [Sulfuriferula sp.]